MENIFQEIKGFFSIHSMETTLFFAGSMGALMSDNHKEIILTRKQRFLRMLGGGVTALLSTQLVVELLQSFTNVELSTPASAGVGFYLGHIGLSTITRWMVRYSENKKK